MAGYSITRLGREFALMDRLLTKPFGRETPPDAGKRVACFTASRPICLRPETQRADCLSRATLPGFRPLPNRPVVVVLVLGRFPMVAANLQLLATHRLSRTDRTLCRSVWGDAIGEATALSPASDGASPYRKTSCYPNDERAEFPRCQLPRRRAWKFLVRKRPDIEGK
jgi:hypothetical protein